MAEAPPADLANGSGESGAVFGLDCSADESGIGPMPSHIDLEQVIFDALAAAIDRANDLSSAQGAVGNLPAIAAECQAAADIARAATSLLAKFNQR